MRTQRACASRPADLRVLHRFRVDPDRGPAADEADLLPGVLLRQGRDLQPGAALSL